MSSEEIIIFTGSFSSVNSDWFSLSNSLTNSLATFDKNGLSCVCRPGYIMENRYEIIQKLGEGSFGQVVEVNDLEMNHRIAVKVIKNANKISEDGKHEVNVLQKLIELDPESKQLCIRMLDCFEHKGHTCIAFELCGQSVYDFLRDNGRQPYTLEQVRHISYQLVCTVLFLHNNQMIHTDLKPENMLFIRSDFDIVTIKGKFVRRIKRSDIRLIDFGSVTFEYGAQFETVTTRYYRAPEVILGLGWKHTIDVWSIGCIMFELYIGITLFREHTDVEHLAAMEKVLGPIPASMFRHSRSHYYSTQNSHLKEKLKTTKPVMGNYESFVEYFREESEEVTQLYNLLTCFLQFVPENRITLREALFHPFFNHLHKTRK